jgi:hypothetical protein
MLDRDSDTNLAMIVDPRKSPREIETSFSLSGIDPRLDIELALLFFESSSGLEASEGLLFLSLCMLILPDRASSGDIMREGATMSSMNPDSGQRTSLNIC